MSIDLDNEKILQRYKNVIIGLESLVRIVTIGTKKSSISVTINVHGMLISGELVSIQNFHEDMKSLLLDNLDQKNDAAIFEPIRDAMQILENLTIIDENGNFVWDYICIKDVSIYLPGFERIKIPFWIGKLESVDGFFVGTM